MKKGTSNNSHNGHQHNNQHPNCIPPEFESRRIVYTSNPNDNDVFLKNQNNLNTTPTVISRTSTNTTRHSPRASARVSYPNIGSCSNFVENIINPTNNHHTDDSGSELPTRIPYTKPRHHTGNTNTNTNNNRNTVNYEDHEKFVKSEVENGYNCEEEYEITAASTTATTVVVPNAKPRSSSETSMKKPKPRRVKQQHNPLPKPRNSIRVDDSNEDDFEDESEIDLTTSAINNNNNNTNININNSNGHLIESSSNESSRNFKSDSSSSSISILKTRKVRLIAHLKIKIKKHIFLRLLVL